MVGVLGKPMAKQARGWLRRPTDTATLRAGFFNALGKGMRQANHQRTVRTTGSVDAKLTAAVSDAVWGPKERIARSTMILPPRFCSGCTPHPHARLWIGAVGGTAGDKEFVANDGCHRGR